MKKILLCFILLLYSFQLFSQNQRNSVFISGTEGHKSYRIPAIIKLPDGELIAFCEGRVNNSSDFGDINIVMKRSRDWGKTWSGLQTIVDYNSLQAGNPAPVVDLTDPEYPEGRIFLFYNTGNKNESEVRKGNGLREVWYKTSSDNGISWSDAVNITAQVHRPKQPKLNKLYNFSEDWRSYANTPGHAMQFKEGKYKGRIYVAANHSSGDPLPHYMDGRAFGYYTDDHGKTFHIGEEVDVPGGNEASATELSEGRLMINVRNQSGKIKARIIAISNNGGQTWDTSYIDKNLPDPVCEGSMTTVGWKKNRNIIAFCNPADTSARNNLTLRISYDNGRTWKKNILIDKSPTQEMSRNYTAYSDIVNLEKNKIGILYERAAYSEIIYTMVKW